jgi:subtilisin family serine protease
VKLEGATGRGVSVAIVDSGVHAGHPHVGNVAGGVGFDAEGRPRADFVDRLGHGTAVAAAIHEKAPDAVLLAIKVFDRALSTSAAALVAAIDWAASRRARLVNLSLGTREAEHEASLAAAVVRAAAAGALVVAAVDPDGPRWLPGCLPGVVPVRLDWECPRDEVRLGDDSAAWFLKASGYPRDIPGVPRERNVKGLSFAVANATGILARLLETHRSAGLEELPALLEAGLISRPD